MGSTTSSIRSLVDIGRIRIKVAKAPPPKRDVSLDVVIYFFIFILTKQHQGFLREEILEMVNEGLPKGVRLTARQLSGHLTSICKLRNTDMVSVRKRYREVAKRKTIAEIKAEDVFDQPPELMRAGQQDLVAPMRPEDRPSTSAPPGQVAGRGGTGSAASSTPHSTAAQPTEPSADERPNRGSSDSTGEAGRPPTVTTPTKKASSLMGRSAVRRADSDDDGNEM